MKTLEKRQFKAMAMAVKDFSSRIGEDIIGALLYSSGHTILSDKEICDLSKKIESEIDE